MLFFGNKSRISLQQAKNSFDDVISKNKMVVVRGGSMVNTRRFSGKEDNKGAACNFTHSHSSTIHCLNKRCW